MKPNLQIEEATTDEQIIQCFPALIELRPNVVRDTLLETIRRQMSLYDYKLLYISDMGKIVTIAGYRVTEILAWGKLLYIDDICTLPEFRNKGFAAQMLDHLIEVARKEKCDQIHLDSGVNRFSAHRLYLSKGFNITAHHFEAKI